MEQQYNVILNDDEISFILIHFQIALDRQSKQAILSLLSIWNASAQFIYSKVRSSFQPMIMWNIDIGEIYKVTKKY
ncbi:hypothetical protein [Enterococcus faecalis]|uniref:hypothetical protein n=1 Tax=Enterococcus faecalis TaxID=1351 RepID=UPI00223930C1|nr:hypothetical protein [Enterococcus faecalis]